MRYEKGDIIFLSLDPTKGHEQAGRRPALVLSVPGYNERTGLVVVVPITRIIKGYPFEVALPDGLEVEGVILSDQIKTLDSRVRKADKVCKAPTSVVDEVMNKIKALLAIQ